LSKELNTTIITKLHFQVVIIVLIFFRSKSLWNVFPKMAYNGFGLGEGTNSVGVVRLDFGFCQTRVI